MHSWVLISVSCTVQMPTSLSILTFNRLLLLHILILTTENNPKQSSECVGVCTPVDGQREIGIMSSPSLLAFHGRPAHIWGKYNFIQSWTAILLPYVGRLEIMSTEQCPKSVCSWWKRFCRLECMTNTMWMEYKQVTGEISIPILTAFLQATGTVQS